MKKWLILASLAILITIPTKSLGNETPFLTWEQLSKLNVETGDMPDSLRELKEKIVEITGFIVPLEMDEYAFTVKEFFLVPDPLACIHVPPPPPNQMIYVKMSEEISLDMDFRGVTIQGIFNISRYDDGIYGYVLTGLSAKPAPPEYEASLEYEDPLLEFFGE